MVNNSHLFIQIMEWSIPIVVVVLAFIIITGVIAYTVYRQKKYGAFCCLMPVSLCDSASLAVDCACVYNRRERACVQRRAVLRYSPLAENAVSCWDK